MIYASIMVINNIFYICDYMVANFQSISTWLEGFIQQALQIPPSTRVEYKSQQPANFAAFSARFRRLLSLLHESRYVEEMDSQPRLLFTKLWLLKNLKKTLHAH